MSNQTIHELTNLSEISPSDELPIWDSSAGATKKVSVEELSLEVSKEVNSYSASEINTGKKWINGKPIYRIVLTTTSSITHTGSSWGGLQTEISNLNINKCIGVTATSASGTSLPIQFSLTQGFRTYGDVATGVDANIILEYTKSTD